MAEEKQCPKCGGDMQAGTLRKHNEYGAHPFEWAAPDDSLFVKKGEPATRHATVVYRCENCGFLEWYAPNPS